MLIEVPEPSVILGVINESDILHEREDEVIDVIDRLVRQACNV